MTSTWMPRLLNGTRHSTPSTAPDFLCQRRSTPHFDTAARLDSKSARSDDPASVASKTPVNSLRCPFGVTNHQTRDTAQVQKEPPHRADTLHPASAATLVGEFERMLIFVIPSSRTDNRADPSRHLATPVPIPHDHPDEPPPFRGEATESFAEARDQTLNPHHTQSPPFEPEGTEPLEHDIGRIYSLGYTDQPKPPPYAASPPTHTSPRAVPRVHPRPPTPPSSRRPPKFTHRSSDATHYRAPTIETDLAELPVAQASIQAGKRSQLNYHLGGPSPRPAPRHVQHLDDDRVEVWGSCSGWGVPSKWKTALEWVRPLPSQVQCHRRRWKVGVEGGKEELRHPEHRVRTKQTRFVVPDPEHAEEGDIVATPSGRQRWSRANDGTRRTSGPGPLRSILRNKPAPYDKGMVRHTGP